jgi:hypothetical protein
LGDISGKLRLIYGSAYRSCFLCSHVDVAICGASIGEDASGLSFHEIHKYADDNAGNLRETGKKVPDV